MARVLLRLSTLETHFEKVALKCDSETWKNELEVFLISLKYLHSDLSLISVSTKSSKLNLASSERLSVDFDVKIEI